jgi:hypothetical protein
MKNKLVYFLLSIIVFFSLAMMVAGDEMPPPKLLAFKTCCKGNISELISLNEINISCCDSSPDSEACRACYGGYEESIKKYEENQKKSSFKGVILLGLMSLALVAIVFITLLFIVNKNRNFLTRRYKNTLKTIFIVSLLFLIFLIIIVFRASSRI